MSQTPKKFPFLRLPMLAMKSIFSKMELQTMFFLSVTSTRVKNALNSTLLKNFFFIDCDFCTDKVINLELAARPCLRLILNDRRAPEGTSSFEIQNMMFKFYIADPQYQNIELKFDGTFDVGAVVIMTHLAEAFRLPKISMGFDVGVQADVASVLLRHAKSLSLPMVDIKLNTELAEVTPAEVYREFLNAGPGIEQELSLICKSARDFTFRTASPQDFKLDTLYIRDGHWVHLEDFMECKDVTIDSTRFNREMYCMTDQRLNEFFKLWKGSECRLEQLEIDYCYSKVKLKFKWITMGLEGTNYRKPGYLQSIIIKREDGKKAEITLTKEKKLYLEVIN